MERTSRLKRVVWLGGISCVLALSVLLVGAAGICGPRMPKLLIAACPVLWITSGWTLWDAIKVLNDENWDRLNSGALGIIAAAVGVFSLSGFMALIGLLNL